MDSKLVSHQQVWTRVTLPGFIGLANFSVTRNGAEVALRIGSTQPHVRDENFASRTFTSAKKRLTFKSSPRTCVEDEKALFGCDPLTTSNVICFDEKIPAGFRPTCLWSDVVELSDKSHAQVFVTPAGDVRIVSFHDLDADIGFKRVDLEYLTSEFRPKTTLASVPKWDEVLDSTSAAAAAAATASILKAAVKTKPPHVPTLTQPSTEVKEVKAKPTEVKTKPTQPSTEVKEVKTKPTAVRTKPTQPLTEVKEVKTKPTEVRTKPTQPLTEVKEVKTKPTEPAAAATHVPILPTLLSTLAPVALKRDTPTADVSIMVADIDSIKTKLAMDEKEIKDITLNQGTLLRMVTEALARQTEMLARQTEEIAALKKEILEARKASDDFVRRVALAEASIKHTHVYIHHLEDEIDEAFAKVSQLA